MNNKYNILKQRVYECNMLLPKYNLVTHTFGNVSQVDRAAGVIGIKPSGVPYDELKPEDIVIVDLDNNVVEGKLRPSSDTKTHTYLYKHFQEVGGIVHTHSTYAVAWAQAQKPIPVYGTTHADHLAREIPCTEVMTDEMIKGDYETETGKQIAEAFKNLSYREIEMVLVSCHGPFTWGITPEKAAYNSLILEEIAKMALLSQQINPQIKTIKKSLIYKHYNRKHGKDAYYGQ